MLGWQSCRLNPDTGLEQVGEGPQLADKLAQLSDPGLLRQRSFVDGKWVTAINGDWFDIAGAFRA